MYVDPLSAADMEFIGNTLFPAIDKSIISKMVAFNNKVSRYFVCAEVGISVGKGGKSVDERKMETCRGK